LGIGDWGLGPIPNPQSPIPNPQSPYSIFYFQKKIIIFYFLEMKTFIYVFYLILLTICLKISAQTYIIYPFKKSTKEIKTYPENLLQNDLEITIEIGKPSQKIDLNLRSKVYSIFVSSSEIGLPYPTYNPKNSKTYVKLSKNISNFERQEYKTGYKIFESFTINQKEINNITLILATKLEYNEAGALGLRLLKTHEFGGNLSFIYQMKAAADLDNYAFTLKYNDDENGEIIIGTYPHLYDKNYNEKKFFFSRARDIGSSIDWVYDFDAIRYDNKSISGIITKSLIQIEFGLILAPFNLKKFFNEKFFLNRCKEEFYSKRNITIFHCDKSIDITEFKDLCFMLKDIDYTFKLTYKDLFIEQNDEYIFSIVFDTNNFNKNPYWILGKPFMKKYQLVYDLDRKIIGLYKDINNNEKNENKNIFYIVLLTVLVVIIIALIVYIIYYNRKPRKSRAFELDDDNFDYMPSSSIN